MSIAFQTSQSYYRCVRVASNLGCWVSVGYLRSTSSPSNLILCGCEKSQEKAGKTNI